MALTGKISITHSSSPSSSTSMSVEKFRQYHLLRQGMRSGPGSSAQSRHRTPRRLGLRRIGARERSHLEADIRCLRAIRAWLAEKRADVLVTIYNDHVTSFFFDHYSPFALGVDDRYLPADEGGGARNVPPLSGAPELARSIANSLFAEEFDNSFFRGKPIDHGCFSPLSMLADPDGTWPWKVLPLQVGVLQFPIPTARRCYRLGARVGPRHPGLPAGSQCGDRRDRGFVSSGSRRALVDSTTRMGPSVSRFARVDPEALTNLTHAEYAERGGFEGAEVIMWLIMRGAMTERIRRLHRTYYLPSMTAIATAIYENDGEYPPAVPYRDQLAGAERLPGTYPYTLERSAKAYRLNGFLHDLIIPEFREAFRRDADALMTAHALTAEEADLVRRRDWRGLIHYGVIFFVLEKLAAVVGCVESACLCCYARTDARRVSSHPECEDRVWRRCQARRLTGTGRSAV